MDTTHSSLHFPLTLPKAVCFVSFFTVHSGGCVRKSQQLGEKKGTGAVWSSLIPEAAPSPEPEGCCWTQGMHSHGKGAVLATHPLGMTLLDR